MLATDVFRSRLQETTTAIALWLAAIDADAEVVLTRGMAWRVRLEPHAKSACPVELILRIDQCFDLMVATEVYEDRPIQNLGLFPKLLQAVTDGRVITRVSASAVTGATYLVESRVTLSDGARWTGTRQVLSHSPAANVDLLHLDRHYLPYKR